MVFMYHVAIFIIVVIDQDPLQIIVGFVILFFSSATLNLLSCSNHNTPSNHLNPKIIAPYIFAFQSYKQST
jgi:hypothetical protein